MQAGLPFLLYKEEYAGVVFEFQGCVFPRIRGNALLTTDPCKSWRQGFVPSVFVRAVRALEASRASPEGDLHWPHVKGRARRATDPKGPLASACCPSRAEAGYRD